MTCNRGREMQCAREIREWFEGVSESLYPNSEVELATGTDHTVLTKESSIEDEIRREVECLTATKRKHIVVHAKLGVDCVVFVQTRYPVDPVKLMLAVCEQTVQRERTARYIQKMAPVQQFIKCEEGLEGVEAFQPVLAEHLRPSTRFAIRPTLRLSPVTRDKAIPAVARLVGPNHSVDLKNWDQLIMVEGLRGVLGISVIDTNAELTKKYCQFNLVQITAGMAQNEVNEKGSNAGQGELII